MVFNKKKKVLKIVEAEADEEVVVEEEPKETEEEPEKAEPKKEVTVQEILINHEQRLVQMEAKWFRLGGI